VAFWWVNHKQTYRQETEGGYLWSPKANADGRRNVTYDNLARCQGGDVVFSYANGKISQIGLVEQAAVTAPKPPEFGTTGDYWGAEGWLVRVNWQPLGSSLVPQTFFELLQPLLPQRHSPISTTSGRGNQVLLLTLSEEASEANDFLADIQELQAVPNATEREALTKARLGQGLFRKRVAQLEPCCRVTGLARQDFLVASHIKPWRDCSNSERLSGANGLLLSPHLDKLFDRHWISFDSSGELIWRHEAAGEALDCWGIKRAHVLRPFSREQERFLELHRGGLRG
jgi:putative restriction endonuclease